MTETRHDEDTMNKPDRTKFDAEICPMISNLRGAALRLTRDDVDADDLVQDTLVRALRFAETYKPGANCKAWLFTILRNTFINGYHRKGRERAFSDLVAGDIELLGSSASIHAFGGGVDDVVAGRSTREHIEAALAQLPADFRLAVSLADLEGFSYKEIAEMMECPVGTVMSRIHRGRKALQKLLRGHAAELGLLELELAA